MSGCARTCILWLLGWVGAAAAAYFYLIRFGRLEPAIWWASVGAGLIATTGVSYVIGVFIAARERSMLLDSLAGTPPRDGAWVAVSGHIRATRPLHAPLSGQAVVAYEYKIYRMERSGKSTSEVRYYEGKALTPSTIATRQGTVRLLAVPTLDVKADEVQHGVAVAHAEKYVSTTTFTPPRTKGLKETIAEEPTDDDGNFRLDKGGETAVDINDCQFEEKSIKQGEMVCAFGQYSHQRGALIPHPNWSKPARLMRGDATEGARLLRRRMINYTIGVVITSAMLYGIYLLYTHYASSETILRT